jgi:hypothetical protein
MTSTTLAGRIDGSRIFRVQIDVDGKWSSVDLGEERR